MHALPTSRQSAVIMSLLYPFIQLHFSESSSSTVMCDLNDELDFSVQFDSTLLIPSKHVYQL